MFAKIFKIHPDTLDQEEEFVMAMPNSCTSCQRFDRAAINCAAFPDGIPVRILMGIDPHTEPYPGDHNLRYMPDGSI